MSKKPNVVVLGSGMAGCGAAHRLHEQGIRPVMYDKDSYHGGHTASFRYETGFLFDIGPHISFSKDERIQRLFADSVEGRYEKIQVSLNNYWRGYWPKHPVQVHLHGLPEDTIVKVIADFVEARQLPEEAPKNYSEWLLASFGRTLAEQFPMRYTRKYHTTDASNMTTDWLGPRIYRPSLEEVIRGAISPTAPHEHYVNHFRYPSDGGFIRYLNKFLPMGDLHLNHKVTSLDPGARHLKFENGLAASYDVLISSVPLPELVRLLPGVPSEVARAAGLLACSTCVLVNIGVNREDLSKAHMTYFYDEDICFTRLGFPHMLSSKNAPPGTGSIQAEIYFSSKYKPFSGTAEDWIKPVISDLRKVGLLREGDEVLSSKAMLLPYANIIFDLDRTAALKTVHGYLDELGIAYCGRYGDWGYLWTDESFVSGEKAAERSLNRLP
jgi:protoporphyrinogen oxidase